MPTWIMELRNWQKGKDQDRSFRKKGFVKWKSISQKDLWKFHWKNYTSDKNPAWKAKIRGKRKDKKVKETNFSCQNCVTLKNIEQYF